MTELSRRLASCNISHDSILVTGIAGLVAGAMSMATGEYVSVHSQADTEKSDLTREQNELQKNPIAEKLELAGIYVDRGLDTDLANQVAEKLMEHDALGAHARDELGISDSLSARPVQAAWHWPVPLRSTRRWHSSPASPSPSR